MGQEHPYIHYNNISTKMIIDYSTDFTTYEIIQSREALIKWAREVGKSHGFMLIIKKSDVLRNGKKGKVLISCEHSEKYKGKKVKFNGMINPSNNDQKYRYQKIMIVRSY